MSVGLQKVLYVVHEARRSELNLDQTQQMIAFMLSYGFQFLLLGNKMEGLSLVPL